MLVFVTIKMASSSCEPKRCSAYSKDLQWHMVYQHEALDLSCKDVAANLCVDPLTVSRIVSLFRRTGQVSKKQYDATNLARKLTVTVQLILLQVILEHPRIRLHEIQDEVEYVTGSYLQVSTICQFLHRSGFSRQNAPSSSSEK